ncbi:hypothetical protein ACJJTC_007348 [Scirpophaga incertulas]
MKKNARKELSYEKRERRCTGGGPPPPKPSDTSEWLCSIMSESIVGLPSTHDSDVTHDIGDVLEEILIPNIENNISIIDVPLKPDSNVVDIQLESNIYNQDKENVSNSAHCFDTTTPKSMLKQPISKQLVSDTRKRKLLCTPSETRKKIVSMANEKEEYLKEKRLRDLKLLQFAEEEHSKNMQHKEELHRLEVEFKKKMNELLLKKTLLEIEIEEQKLKNLKSENKVTL